MLDDPRTLCEHLIAADTETDVETALRDARYWDDPDAWRDFGDNPANASVIGAQQESAEAALVEKIVNSIDACILDACHSRGVYPESHDAPRSGKDAVHQWFDHGMNTDQPSKTRNAAVWPERNRDAQAKRITVTATGAHGDGFASFTITDAGEGQEPDSFGSTFCSLNKGNKRSIPFVQGKHAMGGTGALRFCGAGRVNAHQLQLIVSRRNPDHASDGHDTQWGFTVVRRFPPQQNEKTHTYRYLAPDGVVLRFGSPDGGLGVFPAETDGRADPYGRRSGHGTLTKLYEYLKTSYVTRTPDKELSFARKLELRLPDPLLPVKIYECRTYPAAKKRSSLVLTGVTGRLAGLRDPSETLEWDGHPQTFDFRVDKQLFKTTVWAFKNPARPWRGSDGVFFAFNGQTHGSLSDRFFSTEAVRLSALTKALLIVVDCSDIDHIHESALTMNSRDRLANSEFTSQVKAKLANQLKNHPTLKKLSNERSRYGGPVDERTQRNLQEFLEAHLAANPDLSKYLTEGHDIPNPHPPINPAPKPDLRRYPTYFKFRTKTNNGVLSRPAHLDRDYYRILFVTDAQDDYFDRHDSPGLKCLDHLTDSADINADDSIESWYLTEGTAEMRLKLPDSTEAGDVLRYKFTVTDDNPHTQEFVNEIELTVKPPQPQPTPKPTLEPKPPRPPKSKMPETKPVTEEHWDDQPPEPFTENTAARKIVIDGGGFEVRYNADNKWLRHQIKKTEADDDQAQALINNFGAVMAMLTMSAVGAYKKLLPDNGHPVEDMPLSVDELVEWCTQTAAPIVVSIPNLDGSTPDGD